MNTPRIRPAAIMLLTAWGALGAGCSSSSTPPVDKVVVIDPVKEKLSGDQFQAANAYLAKLFDTLNQGKLTAETFTADFRKKAAPPRSGNEDDRKRGYDILRFDEYLRTVNTGKYLDGAAFFPSPTGPYMIGEAETAGGKRESFVLHLVPTDDGVGWRVNWLHRSKAANAGAADYKGDVGPALAAVRFAENLVGGDAYLADSLLSPAWKQRQHPEVVPADQGVGFNRARVHQTLRSWQDGATDYLLGPVQAGGDGKATAEVFLIDAQKTPRKSLEVGLARTPEGDWLIEEVDVK